MTRTPRRSMLLVTSDLVPDGESHGTLLVEALAARGVDARWVSWTDPAQDWVADLVAVRATWDYHRRPALFVDWARRVERISPLLHGADLFAWNADKAYLLDLAGEVPVVPTGLLDEDGLRDGLAAALEEHGTVVVKPRTGAGGVGLVVAESLSDDRLGSLVAGPWVVQPRVDSIATRGETSVYVFDGTARTQAEKRPASGEVRVHGVHGGSSRAVPLGQDTAALAQDAVRAVERLRGTLPSYARVDLLHLDGGWAVSEVELIEPSLYLGLLPANAEHLAAAALAAL